MSEARLPSAEELTEILQRNSGTLLAVGVVQIGLGLAAIAAPQLATTIGVEFLAVMLCFSGVAQGVLVFRATGWKGGVLLAVGALVSLAMGVLILMDPGGGALAITLLVAIACGAEGLSRVVLGLSPAGAPARGALLLCGAAGLAVGVMLVAEWPGDAVWAIGLLLGINLLMSGASLVGLALAARSGGGPKPA